MNLVEHSPNSHSFLFELKQTKQVPLLFVSDVHFDSRDCQRDLLKKHFDYIKKNNGYILSFGDWFDVMGCHKDPRSKAADVRPEYLSQDRGYLDLIVEDSYNFLEPYIDNLIFFGYGNHETAIIKHRDTDILNTLVFLLKQKNNKIAKGGYSGYINFRIDSNNHMASYLLAYHHGGGGNAPRSKGILHADIDAKNYPDADIIVSGHNHQKGYWPLVCYRRHQRTGLIKYQTRYWVKTGTYKRNEHLPLIGGWAVEKKFDPTPLGGYFCNLIYKNKRLPENDGKNSTFIEAQLIDAN